MKDGKVETVLQENMMLKHELTRLMELVKENEAKQKGFRLVEDAFLLAESIDDIEQKAMNYIEDIFDIDKAVLYINSDLLSVAPGSGKKFERVIFTDDKTLKYAYVDKRPYFGAYLEGLISDFHAIDDIGSYLIAPVIDNGNIIASLNLYSKSAARISGDGEPDFIKDLVLRVGIALKKLHSTNIIVEQSKYDYLTGIYNKAMMEPLILNAVLDWAEKKEPFSFMLLDMDNFKLLNDSFGHIEGDKVLKQTARSISVMLEKGEYAGRFGGDEFYIISKEKTPGELIEKFNNISMLVDDIAAKYNMHGVLGISGGFVCIPQVIEPVQEDILQIIKMADRGLYHSKHAGKGICSPYNN